MNFKQFFDEDSITVCVCLIALAVGYYALKSDFSFFNMYNNDAFNSGQYAIGKISKAESDVRLRGAKNIFWSNARRNDAIAEGDSLFVGPDSNIVIKFQDGKFITIGANSLIKFKTENQKIKLSLQYGSVKSQNLPDQLILDDCGKSMNIQSENADLEISKSSECGNIQLKTQSGQIKVNESIVQKNTPITLGGSNVAKLGEKPLVNEALLKLENLSPEELARLNELSEEDMQKKFDDMLKPLPVPLPVPLASPLLPPQLVKPKLRVSLGKGPPTAAWFKAENAKEYILETSETPDFANPKVMRTPASLQKIENINSDQIYYRLKSVGENDTSSDYSQTGEISLIYPNIEPEEEKIVYDYIAKSSKDFPKEKNFDLKWNGIPKADRYIVEVDSDENFRNPSRYVVRKPASSIKVPGAGSYKFRIAAYNSDQRKISSTNKLGEILYNRIFDIKTPAIDKTASNLTFFFQNGIGKYIWLKWNGEAKANEKFKVEIAKDEEFKNVFKTYSTRKNKLLIQEKMSQGQYYWRVRTESEDNGGQISDWSKLGYIQITTGSL